MPNNDKRFFRDGELEAWLNEHVSDEFTGDEFTADANNEGITANKDTNLKVVISGHTVNIHIKAGEVVSPDSITDRIFSTMQTLAPDLLDEENDRERLQRQVVKMFDSIRERAADDPAIDAAQSMIRDFEKQFPEYAGALLLSKTIDPVDFMAALFGDRDIPGESRVSMAFNEGKLHSQIVAGLCLQAMPESFAALVIQLALVVDPQAAAKYCHTVPDFESLMRNYGEAVVRDGPKTARQLAMNFAILAMASGMIESQQISLSQDDVSPQNLDAIASLLFGDE